MWYRFSKDYGIDVLDAAAEKARQMKAYDAGRHWEILDEIDPPGPLEDVTSDEDFFNRIEKGLGPVEGYLSIHPQIFIYPDPSGKWAYLVDDPKSFKKLDNKHHYDKFMSPYSQWTPIKVIYDWIHEKYPTALIGEMESEEEMNFGLD